MQKILPSFLLGVLILTVMVSNLIPLAQGMGYASLATLIISCADGTINYLWTK